jgi:hypothetical protein
VSPTGPCEPGGPALDLTSAVSGPDPDAAVTSEIWPSTAHRTSRALCARATRSARAQAAAPPSFQ